MDTLPQVVHRIEMLAPALVDDLEDHEALQLTHQVGRHFFFLRGVRVARVLLELLDELLTGDLAHESLVEEFQEHARDSYAAKEEEMTSDLMRELERFVILQVVDQRWREHLDSMDYL